MGHNAPIEPGEDLEYMGSGRISDQYCDSRAAEMNGDVICFKQPQACHEEDMTELYDGVPCIAVIQARHAVAKSNAANRQKDRYNSPESNRVLADGNG
jgi:hypothetical protein